PRALAAVAGNLCRSGEQLSTPHRPVRPPGRQEFAALLHDTTRERALAVAEQIRGSFAAATRQVEGHPVDGTVSIGIVIAYDAVLNLSALLAQADHALYRAKDAGRNRIEIASIDDRAKRGTPEFQRSTAKSATKSAA